MFEVVGDDIAALSDVDLRTLVARLALAEMQSNGLPRSSVTAGGDQDAPDGGLDVRVSIVVPTSSTDFIPRPETGFQVKRSDMTASAIMKEMRPRGKLRPIFIELAERGGAYIIVSSHGTIADARLQQRKKAMRDSLLGLENSGRLMVDFYDRERVSAWVNTYPGATAWVKERVGRRLSGWSAIGKWIRAHVTGLDDYLTEDGNYIIDERAAGREELSLLEGVARMRAALNEPNACVRLIGLSGVGKTRFVIALFEENVGEKPLDPCFAIYTDLSDEPQPSAHEMVRQLILSGQRAFLIIDNCNPATHRQLAKLCGAPGSRLSLLTVEYDVRDDEPEQTGVFRLQTASMDLISRWIGKHFPSISQVDRERIGHFCGGNFGVARALAGTLKKGETLGNLKDRELFQRIIEQRAGTDRDLLQSAEDLSLVYSFDGVDTSGEGELAKLALIRGVPVHRLCSATAEFRQRRIVQVRGRWRAILPHAIANQMAQNALERVSTADIKVFQNSLSPRMLLSFSRRLGYLHNCSQAKVIVVSLLATGGLLEDLHSLDRDGLTILRNVAPVAPQEILSKISMSYSEVDGDTNAAWADTVQGGIVGLVKSLAFEACMFDEASFTLARLARAEIISGQASLATNNFRELFHLYLSGTKAKVEQRIEIARRLANSEDGPTRQCGMIALSALLEVGYFSSSGSFDFGARPRDTGWQPSKWIEIQAWFAKAIEFTIELRHIPEAMLVFARHLRTLWSLNICHNEIEAATAILSDGGAWIDGWISLRATLRYDGGGMNAAVRDQLERITDGIKPAGLADQARAVVLGHYATGYDYIDGDSLGAKASEIEGVLQRASEAAVEIGKRIASSRADFDAILPEFLIAQEAPRIIEFGRGLALGSHDLRETWSELVSLYKAVLPAKRNPGILDAFLRAARTLDENFVRDALDQAVTESSLSSCLPFFQAHVGVDAAGIDRLRQTIANAGVTGIEFYSIANGSVAAAAPSDLAQLLEDISGLPEGEGAAIEILRTYFHCKDRTDAEPTPDLVSVGQKLLAKYCLRKKSRARDASLASIFRNCLIGAEAEKAARQICSSIGLKLVTGEISVYDFGQFIEAILAMQPTIALDEFFPPNEPQKSRILAAQSFRNRVRIDKIPVDVLREWANRNPIERYEILGAALPIFVEEEGLSKRLSISETFVELLNSAPDQTRFLGDYYSRIQPTGWSGSLVPILELRRDLLRTLSEHPDINVRHWVAGMESHVAQWIKAEQERNRSLEQSFE